MRELRDFFRALSDVTRLRLLQRLAASPATVTALTEHVDLSQPLVSWHLRALRSAGLVETRKSGREVICSLRGDAFERCGQQLHALLDGTGSGVFAVLAGAGGEDDIAAASAGSVSGASTVETGGVA